jgi:hypothetical protein
VTGSAIMHLSLKIGFQLPFQHFKVPGFAQLVTQTLHPKVKQIIYFFAGTRILRTTQHSLVDNISQTGFQRETKLDVSTQLPIENCQVPGFAQIVAQTLQPKVK